MKSYIVQYLYENTPSSLMSSWYEHETYIDAENAEKAIEKFNTVKQIQGLVNWIVLECLEIQYKGVYYAQ